MFEQLEKRNLLAVDLFPGGDSNPQFVGRVNEDIAIIRAETPFGGTHFLVEGDEFTEVGNGRWIWGRDEEVVLYRGLGSGATIIDRETGELSERGGFNDIVGENPYNFSSYEEGGKTVFTIESFDFSFSYEYDATCVVTEWVTDCPEFTFLGSVGEEALFQIYDDTSLPVKRPVVSWNGEFTTIGEYEGVFTDPMVQNWIDLAPLGVNRYLDIPENHEIVVKSDSGNSVWTKQGDELFNVGDEVVSVGNIVGEGFKRLYATDDTLYGTESRELQSGGRSYDSGSELVFYSLGGETGIYDHTFGIRGSNYTTSHRLGKPRMMDVNGQYVFMEEGPVVMPYGQKVIVFSDKIVSLDNEPVIYDNLSADANKDGSVNSGDLTVWFSYGLYETGKKAYEFQGNINGTDEVFSSEDLVELFRLGVYK